VHIIGCFATADRAKKSDAMSEQEAFAAALQELTALLDLSIDTIKSKYDESLRCVTRDIQEHHCASDYCGRSA